MADRKERIGTVCENIRVLVQREENNRAQIRLSARLMSDLWAECGESIGRLWEKLSSLGTTPIFKINLCKCLCENPKYRSVAEKALRGDNEKVAESARGRIAYVRNKRNDKVFLEFSKTVGGAKAYYCTSFTDACEAVFNDTCEFCILPIQNGKEGKLYSFYTMLDRHELKIAHTVTEEETDTQESVSFALVGRSLFLQENKHLRYEFSLIGENVNIIWAVTEAAKELGGIVSDVGTLPVAYDQPRRRFYLSVDIPAEGIDPLTMYLSMENLGFEALGLYEI